MTNDPSAEHPLAAFQAAFYARKEAALDVYVERSIALLGGTMGTPPESFRARRALDLDTYIEAITDPSARALREHTKSWVTGAIRFNVPAETVQAMATIVRRQLLDVGLEIARAGVPRATDGIRRLVQVSAEPIHQFDVAYRERAEAMRRMARIYEAVIEKAPDAIGVAEPSGHITRANPAMHAIMRAEVLVGRSLYELVAPRSREHLRTVAAKVIMERGFWTGPLAYVRGDGTEFEALVTAFIVRDDKGKDLARCAILRDLSAAREAEAERQRLVAEVISAQNAALEEIGTPLVPVAEGVLVMPLVGRLDASRSERMLGVLLDGVARDGARVVLVDVTGVKEADAAAAGGLVRAAGGVRMLGAELVVTGIGPGLARTLVELDAGFSEITTKATLGDGVAHALRHARRRG